MMELVKIGRRMRTLRIARKLTQAQVAEAAGIETSFYGQVERGANTPSVKTLLAVARALKVPPAHLLPDGGPPLRRRYAAAIITLLEPLSERDLKLVLGVVSDVVSRLKR